MGSVATDSTDPVNPSRRKAGRPRGELLNRTKIGDAALRLVRDRGYDNLTMSALARALGVSASALYNHVESKQDLLALIQDLVMADVDCSGFRTLPLAEALLSWAVSYRNVFAAHAPLVPVIAVLPVARSPRTLQMYEGIAAGFSSAGWERDRIIPAIVALESFIFGSALDAVAPKNIFDVGVSAEGVPEFAAAVAGQRLTAKDPAQDAFEYGLVAIIAGIIQSPKTSSRI